MSKTKVAPSAARCVTSADSIPRPKSKPLRRGVARAIWRGRPARCPPRSLGEPAAAPSRRKHPGESLAMSLRRSLYSAARRRARSCILRPHTPLRYGEPSTREEGAPPPASYRRRRHDLRQARSVRTRSYCCFQTRSGVKLQALRYHSARYGGFEIRKRVHACLAASPRGAWHVARGA